ADAETDARADQDVALPVAPTIVVHEVAIGGHAATRKGAEHRAADRVSNDDASRRALLLHLVHLLRERLRRRYRSWPTHPARARLHRYRQCARASHDDALQHVLLLVVD